MYLLLPAISLLVSSFSKPASSVEIKPPAPMGVIYTSYDNGNSWVDLSKGLPTDTRPFSFLAVEDQYYFGTAKGVFRNRSYGTDPKWQKESFEENSIPGIYPGKDGPYAISHWNGFYQFQHGLWNPMAQNLNDKFVHVVHETQTGVLYAGCESGLYKSMDHGNSWNLIFNKCPVSSLAETNEVLIIIGTYGLWRSPDGGDSWNQVLTGVTKPINVRAVDEGFIAIREGQEFAWARTPHIVYLSTDNGLTWKPMPNALPVELYTVYDYMQAGDYHFSCSQNGIFRSADHGTTWQPVFRVPTNRGGFFELFTSGKQLFTFFIEGC